MCLASRRFEMNLDVDLMEPVDVDEDENVDVNMDMGVDVNVDDEVDVDEAINISLSDITSTRRGRMESYVLIPGGSVPSVVSSLHSLQA